MLVAKVMVRLLRLDLKITYKHTTSKILQTLAHLEILLKSSEFLFVQL